jgi:ubiquinone biosynthesis protein COQ9
MLLQVSAYLLLFIPLTELPPELHQLTSPETAARFLDGLLEANTRASNSVSELATFANYMGRSWIGIARSKGLLS